MGLRDKSLHDFALGGRNVPWFAVMASIIAAETSAATFLATPGEGFASQRFLYVQLIAGLIMGRVLSGTCSSSPTTLQGLHGLRLPRHPLRAGVEELRLGAVPLHADARIGTRMFVPSLVMVLAWQLFAAGDQKVKSFTPTTSGYVIAIVIITLLTCLYTAVGGSRAVIWTDVIQATLMFGTALVAIGMLLHHIGGSTRW